MRAIRLVVRGLLFVASVLAGFIGLYGFAAIVVGGIRSVLDDFSRIHRDTEDEWVGLLVIGCAGYFVFLIVKAIVKDWNAQKKRYADLYAAAIRLKETGQTLQDAVTRGSRGELLSAELHWHDAVTDMEAFRPPTKGSRPLRPGAWS